MSVREAVERDLERLPTAVREGGLAALALAMADQIDDGRTSSTSKSMNARVLKDTLETLALVESEEPVRGVTDELRDRRASRWSTISETSSGS